LDANFGGVLIIFDRLFGTFVEEKPGVGIRYGLVEPIQSNNPLRIGLSQWWAMLRDVTRSGSVRGALAAVFGPPRARKPVANCPGRHSSSATGLP
ncbi:MAG: hypothetical protein QOD58_4915, partial [Mycobacterium sp.]|nr:hypothetical protein [Mycobacterium sp.]